MIDITRRRLDRLARCTTTCPTTPATTGATATRPRSTRRSRRPRTSPSSTFVNNRLIPNAIEPRAANAAYNRSDESYTLYVANQNPHVERLLMCAFVLGLPESKVRVIAPDVGGGFGSKIFLYPEDVALVWASKRVGRPIKWTAERSESFLTDAHGRDHVTTAELAMDAEGNFLALRVKTIANMGAYLSTFASAVPTILYATLLAGQYKTPAIYAEVKAVFTNTAPVDAYRGAGRPEATYVVERIVEQAAREMKMDPAEIRRKNFITDLPVRDAGRPDLRRRRLRGAPRQGDRDRRRRRLPGAQGRVGGEGQEARPRLRLLHRGVRHRAVEHRRRARRARRPVRGRRGARPSDRHGDRLHRLAQPRPGPRDDVRAGRRRASSASRSTTSRSSTATPAACRSAWAPTAAARSRSAARRSSRRSTR